MPSTLKDLGEFRLIDQLAKTVRMRPGVINGIGDDAAVLDIGHKDFLLLTTDMLVEGVHFLRNDPAIAIGHKAMACNLSDIVAMGGLPLFAVVSLGLVPALSVKFVQDLYKGMNRLAKRFHVAIVGGDTNRAQKVVINVGLLGKVEKNRVVTRSGAQKGDWIFLTGPLGRSLPSGRHLRFFPRVKEARFLVDHFQPNAMIDISDCLIADLGHILNKSGVGATLWEKFIPRTKGSSLSNAFYDGEDFELIFTLPEQKAKRLLARGPRRTMHFYPIGRIEGRPRQIFLFDRRGRKQSIDLKGFQHF